MGRSATPARVLVVIKGLGLGGAEQLIASGSEFWDRSSFDYRVAYLLPWKDHFVPTLEKSGVPVVCVGSLRGFSLKALRMLKREISEADLVHVHLPMTGILVRLLAGRLPVVYTEHNLAHSYKWLTRHLNRLTYRLNASVVAVSDGVAATLADYPGPPVEVIPNGVALDIPHDTRRQVRDEIGLDPDQPLLVQVANVRPGKGHDHLVDVMERVVRVRPDAVAVSIGSEKTPGDLERLRDRARSAGLEPNLRFLGPRPDAVEFTAAADLFISPSEIEGLPVSLLEAMAVERAVVATAVGGVPGVIESGVNGVLVTPGDADEMAAAILALLSSPEQAKSLAAAGRATVDQRYHLRTMVQSYETLYTRVLGGVQEGTVAKGAEA